MPRKISAKELAEDIRSGMHDNQLMVKYEVSVSQLREMRTKLEATGLVPKTAQDGAPPRRPPQGGALMSCPSCGYSMDGTLDECPRCGLIVSRVQRSAPAGQMPQSYGSRSGAAAIGIPSSRGRGTGLVIGLAVAFVAAIVVIACVMTHRKNLSHVLNTVRPTAQLIASSDPLEVDWQAIAGELNDIKQRNQGFLSGWTGDMDTLLPMATRMIKVSKKERQVLDAMNRQEQAEAAPTQGEPAGLGNPIERQYQEASRKAKTATRNLGDYRFGGKLPTSRLAVQEEFMALNGQIRDLCKKLIETK